MSMERKITQSEMRNAFELLAEIFQEADAEQKFIGLAAMLRLTSQYLRQEIEGIDTTAVLLVLEELSKIDNGGAPDFIKATNSSTGRPKLIGNNYRLAAITAAVELCIKDGMRPGEAVEFTAKKSGLSVTRIAQIRKEFREGKRHKGATNFIQQQLEKARNNTINKLHLAEALIEVSTKKGG